MPSRIVPLEYLKERDLMFWLPPGGQDNEVWADTWVILAELESAYAAPVLALLHDADVGAYIARPSGLRGAASRSVHLYVDREQHNKAVDVLMLFLRGRDRPPAPVKSPVRKQPKPTKRTPSAAQLAVLMVLRFVLGAVFVALFLWLIYHDGPRVFPTVHPSHSAPAADTPGIQRP
jgi:hypothetical protein